MRLSKEDRITIFWGAHYAINSVRRYKFCAQPSQPATDNIEILSHGTRVGTFDGTRE